MTTNSSKFAQDHSGLVLHPGKLLSSGQTVLSGKLSKQCKGSTLTALLMYLKDIFLVQSCYNKAQFCWAFLNEFNLKYKIIQWLLDVSSDISYSLWGSFKKLKMAWWFVYDLKHLSMHCITTSLIIMKISFKIVLLINT